MSGIYIPGMGMPQGDEVITIYPDGTAHRHHLGLRLRISESKAIPVPEHGDLIDRNETVKTLAHDYAYAAADMVRDEMPTIIPADHIGDANEMVTDKEGEK